MTARTGARVVDSLAHCADVIDKAGASILDQIQNMLEPLSAAVVGVRDFETLVPGAELSEAMQLALELGWTLFLQNSEVTVIERQDHIKLLEVVGLHLACT